MYYTPLSQRGLLSISGEDRLPFLQGLVTNNVEKLKDGKPVYAALLSPQGKFLHDFFLIPEGGAVLLDGEKERLPDLMRRLAMYKLRSKVEIKAMPEMGVVAAWGSRDSAKGFVDPRLPQLGWRIAGDVAGIDAWCMQQGWQRVDELAYDRMRLELGVPDGSRDLEIDRAVISHYGFEDLNGVDFQKGCYVGQEVIARTKYRGQIRKFLYGVQAESGVLPAPGTPVRLGEASSGELHSVSGNIGLAVLRVEDVEKSHQAKTPFTAGEVTLNAFLPQWVKQAPSSAAGE